MAITYQSDVVVDYAQLSCQGTFSVKAILGVYEAALKAADDEGLAAVLVDIRDLGGLAATEEERYDMGVAIARMQRHSGKSIRLAVVGAPPILDPSEFAEDVSVNRGAVARGFTDVDDAVAWLREKDAQ